MMAWHYTVGLKLPLIRESGTLRPADAYIAPGERPILWFSTNQYWEKTAAKAVREAGSTRMLSMRETAERGKGLYRFGLPAEQLTRWPEIGKQAGIRAAMRNALMRVGRAKGANPAEWYGTLGEMPVDGLLFQRLADFCRWGPAALATL